MDKRKYAVTINQARNLVNLHILSDGILYVHADGVQHPFYTLSLPGIQDSAIVNEYLILLTREALYIEKWRENKSLYNPKIDIFSLEFVGQSNETRYLANGYDTNRFAVYSDSGNVDVYEVIPNDQEAYDEKPYEIRSLYTTQFAPNIIQVCIHNEFVFASYFSSSSISVYCANEDTEPTLALIVPHNNEFSYTKMFDLIPGRGNLYLYEKLKGHSLVIDVKAAFLGNNTYKHCERIKGRNVVPYYVYDNKRLKCQLYSSRIPIEDTSLREKGDEMLKKYQKAKKLTKKSYDFSSLICNPYNEMQFYGVKRVHSTNYLVKGSLSKSFYPDIEIPFIGKPLTNIVPTESALYVTTESSTYECVTRNNGTFFKKVATEKDVILADGVYKGKHIAAYRNHYVIDGVIYSTDEPCLDAVIEPELFVLRYASRVDSNDQTVLDGFKTSFLAVIRGRTYVGLNLSSNTDRAAFYECFKKQKMQKKENKVEAGAVVCLCDNDIVAFYELNFIPKFGCELHDNSWFILGTNVVIYRNDCIEWLPDIKFAVELQYKDYDNQSDLGPFHDSRAFNKDDVNLIVWGRKSFLVNSSFIMEILSLGTGTISGPVKAAGEYIIYCDMNVVNIVHSKVFLNALDIRVTSTEIGDFDGDVRIHCGDIKSTLTIQDDFGNCEFYDSDNLERLEASPNLKQILSERNRAFCGFTALGPANSSTLISLTSNMIVKNMCFAGRHITNRSKLNGVMANLQEISNANAKIDKKSMGLFISKPGILFYQLTENCRFSIWAHKETHGSRNTYVVVWEYTWPNMLHPFSLEIPDYGDIENERIANENLRINDAIHVERFNDDVIVCALPNKLTLFASSDQEYSAIQLHEDSEFRPISKSFKFFTPKTLELKQSFDKDSRVSIKAVSSNKWLLAYKANESLFVIEISIARRSFDLDQSDQARSENGVTVTYPEIFITKREIDLSLDITEDINDFYFLTTSEDDLTIRMVVTMGDIRELFYFPSERYRENPTPLAVD